MKFYTADLLMTWDHGEIIGRIWTATTYWYFAGEWHVATDAYPCGYEELLESVQGRGYVEVTDEDLDEWGEY